MSEIICRSISNGREFEVPNDYFRSLHALRSECNSYTLAEERYTELLAEHNKQIREDAIEECARTIEISKTLFENHQTETIMVTKDKCIAMIRNLKIPEGGRE